MNVVICDDHRLFTEALARALSDREWSIVECAVDPAQAVAAVARESVDVCLMDLQFPDGVTGLEGIVSVHETSPATRVIVLSATSDPTVIMRAVECGADAIVFKDDDIDHIIEVVETPQRAFVGSVAPSRAAASQPAPGAANRDIAWLGQFLTARESEVLERLVHGESAKQLALHMGIAYSTARTHIQNILAKLGVHSRLEAVAFAVEHDLCRTGPVTNVQTRFRSRSD